MGSPKRFAAIRGLFILKRLPSTFGFLLLYVILVTVDKSTEFVLYYYESIVLFCMFLLGASKSPAGCLQELL